MSSTTSLAMMIVSLSMLLAGMSKKRLEWNPRDRFRRRPRNSIDEPHHAHARRRVARLHTTQRGDAYLARRAVSGYPDAVPKPTAHAIDMTTCSPAAKATTVVTDALTVGDAMSPSMIRCGPHTPLRVVARMMATHGIHAVYVFDYGAEDDETVSIWGIVSDLDLVASWSVVDQRTAGSTAVQPLVTVSVDDRLERAAQKMAETDSAHLAVIDPKTGRPLGVLSTLDVARVIGAFPGASGRTTADRASGDRPRGGL